MPNPEITILIKAAQQGFDQVITELNKLQAAMKGVQTSVPVAALNNLSSDMANLAKRVDEATNAMNKLATSGRGVMSRLTMEWNLKSFIGDMEKMIAVQLRWYAARALVNPALAVVGLPATAAKAGFDFMKSVDQAEATIARYGAMEGETREKYRATAKEIVEQSRQIALNMPIAFEEVIKVADRLRAAGIELDTVKGSLTTFAKLQITFPEIEPEKFTNAIVGFLNTFRTSPGLAGLENDTERFKAILDKITMALSIGVIAPKDINILIQHLGQMSQAAGFSIDQMLALSVMITNLGSKAGSAGRLLSGFLSSMGTEKFQKEMEALGYTMDRQKTIAQQFTDVIRFLREKLGTGKLEGLTLGGTEEIGKLTSAERQKIVIALNREIEQYERYLASIQASGGALERAYGPMSETVKSSLTILKNTALETAYAFLQLGGDAENAKTIIDLLIVALKALSFTFVAVGSAIQVVMAPFLMLGRILIAITAAVIEFAEAWGQLKKAINEGDYSAGIEAFKNKTKLALASLRIDLADAAEKFNDALDEKKIRERHEKAYALIYGSPEREAEKEGYAPAGHPQAHETAPDKETPTKTDKEKGRLGSLRGIISAEKSILQAEYQKIRTIEQQHIQEIDRIHQAGLMSDEQWGRSKIAIAKQAYEDQVAILDKEKALINQEYAELLSDKDLQPTARKAVLARQRADMLQIENKYVQAAVALNKIEVDTEIRNYQRGLQQWTQFEQTRLQLYQSFISARENLTEAHLDRVRAILDSEYNDMKTISSTEYFAGRESLIQAETQNQLIAINQRQEAWRSFHNAQLEEYKDNTSVRAQLELEGFRTEQHFSLERLKVQSDTATKINQMMIERAKDPQWVYEYTKNFTVLIVEMNRVAVEWQKVGLHLVNIAKGTADAISGTFESMLNDLYDNKFKKFGDYVNAFMKDISKTVFKTISQHFTGMLIQGTFKLLGIEVPDLLKGAKQFIQAQNVEIQAALVNLEGQIPEMRTPPEIPIGETPLGQPSEHLPAGSPEAMAQEAAVLSQEAVTITESITVGSAELTSSLSATLTTGATEVATSLTTVFSEAVASLSAWGSSLVTSLQSLIASLPVSGVENVVEEIPFVEDLLEGGGVSYAARGAKASPREPFIVGEEGPELFVPDTAGTIVPSREASYSPTQFKSPSTYVDDMGYPLTDVGQSKRAEDEKDYRKDYYTQKESEASSAQGAESASGGNPLLQIGMVVGALTLLTKAFNKAEGDTNNMSESTENATLSLANFGSKLMNFFSSFGGGGGGGGGFFGGLASLFEGGGGGAEVFGANELLTWAAMAHTGRQAYGDFPSYKLVPAGVFAGAPRHHSGNLAANERAVVITDDEHVIPNNKVSRAGAQEASSQQPVIVQFNVSAIDSASFAAYVNENRKVIANAVVAAQGDNHRVRRGR